MQLIHSLMFFIDIRGGYRAAATSKMERFVIIVTDWKLKAVNYYHKGLHQGCLSSPRSASDNHLIREQTLHHLAKMANEALGLKI